MDNKPSKFARASVYGYYGIVISIIWSFLCFYCVAGSGDGSLLGKIIYYPVFPK